jgi:hypothetical protein
MAPTPEPLPAHLRGVPFRSADARSAGVSRGRLDGGDLHRAHRDVFVPAATKEDLAVRCAAALCALPPGSALSHHTAAELRGLPLPSPPRGDDGQEQPYPVHVMLRAPDRARVRGIVVHQSRGPVEAETVRGLALTGLVRTWIDLSAFLGRTDLTILGDAVLRTGRVSLAGLATAVGAAGRRRGVLLARQVLPLLAERVDSPMETRMRLFVVDAAPRAVGADPAPRKLPEPLVNQPLHDDAGGFIGTPDIRLRGTNVLLQYEGAHHWEDARRRGADIRRDELYRAHGYESVRLVADDIFVRPARTVDRIWAAVERDATSRARARTRRG